MTKDEIMNLGFEDLETRASEIAEETKEADETRLADLSAELDAIEERKKALEEEAEQRKTAAKEVAEGRGVDLKPAIEIKEEKPMEMEVRNSNEYIEAFAKYVKTGNDKECRALLTDNVQNGVVPVPTFVGEIIAARLEESEILRRTRKMNARGNVKIGFEIDAPAALPHTEGGAAIAEEELSLGIVTLKPVTLKKWVAISDEALDSMNGEEYLRYVYDEVTRGIIAAREAQVVGSIYAATDTATPTAPAVAQYSNNGTAKIDDFIQARALLSSAAKDIVIIVTPAQYAAYKSLQMSAQYAVDPFDGHMVLFNDTVTEPIIGDLAGYMENLPKGDAVEFKYDDTSLMTSDMVRVLGRLPIAAGVVGNKYFARITA